MAVNVNENKQSDDSKLNIIRKLFLPVVIGNCINRENFNEYYNEIIYEYSKSLEELQNCEIVIDIARALYLIDYNSSYNRNNYLPLVCRINTLDVKRKTRCEDFAKKYIVDEYNERIVNILHNPSDRYSSKFTKDSEITEYYKGKQEQILDNNIKRFLVKLAINNDVYEDAINVATALITDPSILIVFDYVFEIVYRIIVGLDIDDIVDKFNGFNESSKKVAMRYIDKYFDDVYKGILHEKLEFGTQK